MSISVIMAKGKWKGKGKGFGKSRGNYWHFTCENNGN